MPRSWTRCARMSRAADGGDERRTVDVVAEPLPPSRGSQVTVVPTQVVRARTAEASVAFRVRHFTQLFRGQAVQRVGAARRMDRGESGGAPARPTGPRVGVGERHVSLPRRIVPGELAHGLRVLGASHREVLVLDLCGGRVTGSLDVRSIPDPEVFVDGEAAQAVAFARDLGRQRASDGTAGSHDGGRGDDLDVGEDDRVGGDGPHGAARPQLDTHPLDGRGRLKRKPLLCPVRRWALTGPRPPPDIRGDDAFRQRWIPRLPNRVPRVRGAVRRARASTAVPPPLKGTCTLKAGQAPNIDKPMPVVDLFGRRLRPGDQLRHPRPRQPRRVADGQLHLPAHQRRRVPSLYRRPAGRRPRRSARARPQGRNGRPDGRRPRAMHRALRARRRSAIHPGLGTGPYLVTARAGAVPGRRRVPAAGADGRGQQCEGRR